MSEANIEGSCFCGQSKITCVGEPQMKALCHCSYCHKITGSTYSTNLIFPLSAVSVASTSTLKIASHSDPTTNALLFTNHFCSSCGTTLYQDGPAFPGMAVVKAGALDGEGILDGAKPVAELFTGSRAEWVGAVEGAVQRVGM